MILRVDFVAVRVFVIALAASVILPTCACALDFLGVQLGQPLTLSACVKKGPPVNCVDKGRVSPDELGGSLYFTRYRAQQTPDYIDTGFIRVYRGQVVEITAYTTGLTKQEEVMLDLRAKFGQPSATGMIEKQNSWGMKLSVRKALWKKRDLNVEFEGVTNRSDQGRIEVSNSLAEEYWRKMEALPPAKHL